MIKKFIERPVLSTVISILIVLLGYLGIVELPIERFPDIAPPTVTVEANYPGANAETILKSVVTPIEEAINGVEGMSYISSVSSNAGTARIYVYFELGTDADIAAVNVQNRVAKVTNQLPQVVMQTGVETKKVQNSTLMFAAIYSKNEDFDYNFLDNYAKINLVPILQRINGVSDVDAFGMRDYSMRVWLKPDKMAAYGLLPDDVARAIQEQNIEAAPGKFGENSFEVFEYTIRYKGTFYEEQEYENIIIRSEGNGDFLRLKDVADIELGAFSYMSTNITQDYPSVAFAIKQTSDSNANDIIIEIVETLKEAAKDFPPGVEYVIPMNSKDFLDESISQVLITLVLAFILVFLVVLAFLQDFRATLIPSLAVPVAIIGTFFFLNLFGFSINMLTMFAMVLAIGIVVDNAIVVVEAVYVKLDEGVESSFKAAVMAMNEIMGAIISSTLVLAAVFLPVTFLGGPTGLFYSQIAITLTIAVIISAINALTLSPALCALFLKPLHKRKTKHYKSLSFRLSTVFNKVFDKITDRYVYLVNVFMKKMWIPLLFLVGCACVALLLFKNTPTGFIPAEDQGIIFCDLELPPGTTLERTTKIGTQVNQIIAEMPIVEARMMVNGYSLLSGANGSSRAFIVIKLKHWKERTQDEDHIDAVVRQLYGAVAHIKEANILFFTPPTVPGFGNSSGFEFQVQDRTGGDLRDMEDQAKIFLMKLNQRPEIAYAVTSFSTQYPQYEMTVNVEKVKEAGMDVSMLFSTMQAYFGSRYISDFNRFGKQYRVVIQAKPEERATIEALNQIYVRNNEGESVAISQFVEMTKTNGPDVVERFNLFNAAKVMGAAAPGYSSGDAIAVIEEVAQGLPTGFGYEFSGMTREERKSGGDSFIVFLLSLVFVYFLLSAQYESYIIPFAVILSLPVGILGAILFINLFNIENNIYFQVALIMLIGLLGKNAILIVEYALQNRQKGASLIKAATDAARIRLRPIIMTSFTCVLGLLPLMLASGAGALGNRSIGTGAVGGMFIGTVLGVFVIPALFVIFQRLQERLQGKETSHNVATREGLLSETHQV
ncbi:efflux RND transporter permease subunit [Aureibacter tunicatorum]|uniref:HAE1 family hydrophobic/amphiphilic exporter-1 n=1 Tax=Aureibacter tunicatorum TaxID=866807 RepID=A0AAE3XSE9_9BACT|nr:efflux RND transporter permease subunit [Aureibacter tunicatorum]MDR6241169.1 HAE1 family hydrophobic/amphiphilic exporter-1 [Aureibacter tunicatorum]BDD03944.1 multidrug transporter AcrB [Aureibacter tunicatorum]